MNNEITNDEVKSVVRELLVKANKARQIAEAKKTRVPAISIKMAEYSAYLDAAKMTAGLVNMGYGTFVALNEEIWREMNT